MNKDVINPFEYLIEEIQSAVSNFSYDEGFDDFDITVRIVCEDGWCRANIINVNDNERS